MLRLKEISESLRFVLPRLSDSDEITTFFDSVEKIFSVYCVDSEFRLKLLLPLLSTKAKSAVSRLSLDDLQSYDSVKLYLLNEFRESARKFK